MTHAQRRSLIDLCACITAIPSVDEATKVRARALLKKLDPMQDMLGSIFAGFR